MIPSENKDAFSKAPPTKVLNNPNSPVFMSVKASARLSPSTPGIGMCAPMRTIIKTPIVKRIRCLSSGIMKILLILSIIIFELYRQLSQFFL